MKLYLSGPMSGIPQYNFPAFTQAALVLRALGHEVLSPHELDTPEQVHAALASTDGHTEDADWAAYLARDIVEISKFDPEAIVVLPGWEDSRGCKIETLIAHLLLCDVYSYEDMLLDPEGLWAARKHPRDMAETWATHSKEVYV